MSNTLKRCSNYQDLIGRAELKKQLIKLVSEAQDRLIVLSAAAGSDKEAWALALASNLLCQNPGAEGACLECDACKYLAAGTNPDFIEILPTEKNKNIPIDTIREKVHAEVYLLPQISPRKVWYIDANALLETAENSLLKVLEEPPEYTFFILTVDDKNSLLPTLQSRARIIEIPLLSEREIAELLDQEGISDPAQRQLAVKFSAGLADLALELASNSELNQQRAEIFAWFKEFGQHNPAEILTDDFAFWDTYKKDIDIVILFVQSFLRDLMLLASTDLPAAELKEKLLNPDYFQTMYNLQKSRQFQVSSLAVAVSQLNEMHKRLRANANFELTVCAGLLRLRECLN